MSKPKQRNSWLVTMPIAMIAAAYLWFVFLPGRRAIETVRAELLDKQAFIGGADRVMAGIGNVEAELRQCKAYCQSWHGGSMDSTEMTKLFRTIAEVLESSGVVTTKFTPESGTSLDMLQKIPVHLGFEGSFQQISEVLTKLESLSQRIWVEQISMQVNEEHRETVTCELSLAIFAGKLKKND